MKSTVGAYDALLSPLERCVLDQLWQRGPMRVRDIHKRVRATQKVALSSVAVILDRLHSKGIVSRTAETCRGGTRYIYEARQSKDEFARSIIDHAVGKLIARYGNTAVAYFNERFAKR
jgi:predicted transcriptional regulator